MKRINVPNVVSLWAILTCVFAIVPFTPWIAPIASLDISWIIGLNQAVADELSFGNQIVMTFGPYSSVGTAMYSSATDGLMLFGSMVFALGYALCLVFLAKSGKPRVVVLICLFLATLVYLRDVFFISYSLVAAITLYRRWEQESETRPGLSLEIAAALVFVPLGLLPLIKGTFLLTSAATAIVSAGFFFANRRYAVARNVLLAPAVSLIIFWLIAGQSLTALPAYVINLYPIIAGYTEAMSGSGPWSETLSFIVAALAVLSYIFLRLRRSRLECAFVFLIFALFLFVSFKAGFVRHDSHALIPGGGILLAALCLLLLKRDWKMVFPFVMGVVAWGVIDHHYQNTTPTLAWTRFTGTYKAGWDGIKTRIKDPKQFDNQYRAAIQSFYKPADFPKPAGSADIYSYAQSELIGSGADWSPRPTFQSYAAYTPGLIEANRLHLIGPRAPVTVILKIEPIDGRYPAIEDGASWPVFLSNYHPTSYGNGYLSLQRRDPETDSPRIREFKKAAAVLGQRIEVPATGNLMLARFDLRPTLLGKAVSFLYKPTQLNIEVELEGEVRKTFRLVSTMARSPFLISPYVESGAEFGLLYEGSKLMAANRVVAFRVVSEKGDHDWQWQSKYRVTFSTLEQPAPTPVPNSLTLAKFQDAAPLPVKGLAPKCDGVIDYIGGSLPKATGFVSKGLLKVQGWMALSTVTGDVPDAVYVTLTTPDGHSLYSKATSVDRGDVATYFKQPSMQHAGYTSFADVSFITGKYALGLAVEKDGAIYRCEQFAFAGSFN